MIAVKRGSVLLHQATPQTSGVVKLSVTLDNATGVAAAIPHLKYNKSKWVCFEMDDASKSLYSAYNNKLKTTHYTDGCGNNINFSCAVAVNGKDQSTDEEVGNLAGALTYAQRGELIPFGLDVMNHSMYHDTSGTYNNGTNAVLNVQQLDALILLRQNYKMNCLVVPTNYDGYMDAAAGLGYVGGSSTGTFDSHTPYPEWTTRGYVSDIPATNYQAIRRDFTDVWTNAGSQWSLNNDLFNNGYSFYTIGTHGLWSAGDTDNFNSWIDDIKTRGGDSVIFTSLRELLEYRHLRSSIDLTQTIDGNVLEIVLDFNTVNENLSWHDLSFIINSGQIQTVSVDDNTFAVSFNASTKLINIKKRKTAW